MDKISELNALNNIKGAVDSGQEPELGGRKIPDFFSLCFKSLE